MSVLVQDTVDFGNVYPDDFQDIVLKIVNDGVTTLTISNVAVSGAGFSLISALSLNPLPPEAAGLVTLRFSASGSFGERTAELTITSNDPLSPRVIALMGNVADPLDYVSYEAEAEMFGITEFGDVSNPPRKYLRSISTPAGITRSYDSPSTWFNLVGISNRLAFNTAGAKDEQFEFFLERPGAQARDVIDTVSEVGWVDSGETAFADNAPEFTRTKRTKTLTGFIHTNPVEAPATFRWENIDLAPFGGDFPQDNILFRISIAWVTDHYELECSIGSPQGGTANVNVRAAIAQGDTLPEGADTGPLVASGPAASGFTFTLNVPPDASVRFHVEAVASPSGSDFFPKVWDVEGWEDAGQNPWFYLPANPADLAEPNYTETLAVEDTPVDALIRAPGVVIARNPIARTTNVTGGVTAESYDPIMFTGRAVRASRIYTDLTVGNRYTFTVVLRLNTIGSTDYTTEERTFDFIATSTTQFVPFKFAAPIGKEARVINWSRVDNGPEVNPSDYETETMVWLGKVLAEGGTLESDSLDLAEAQIVALKALPFFTSIYYYAPLLGGNLAAALVPLIDRDARGVISNSGFVNGDFSQALGLQGANLKILTLPFRPDELGTSNNGGLFWGELDLDNGGSWDPIGSSSVVGRDCSIILSPTEFGFRWSDGAGQPSQAGAPTNGRFHGERSSSVLRKAFKNGALVATNTTNDNGSGGGINLRAMGFRDAGGTLYYWLGRAGYFGATDGTLSEADVAALDVVFADLLTETGRS